MGTLTPPRRQRIRLFLDTCLHPFIVYTQRPRLSRYRITKHPPMLLSFLNRVTRPVPSVLLFQRIFGPVSHHSGLARMALRRPQFFYSDVFRDRPPTIRALPEWPYAVRSSFIPTHFGTGLPPFGPCPNGPTPSAVLLFRRVSGPVSHHSGLARMALRRPQFFYSDAFRDRSPTIRTLPEWPCAVRNSFIPPHSGTGLPPFGPCPNGPAPSSVLLFRRVSGPVSHHSGLARMALRRPLFFYSNALGHGVTFYGFKSIEIFCRLPFSQHLYTDRAAVILRDAANSGSNPFPGRIEPSGMVDHEKKHPPAADTAGGANSEPIAGFSR